MTAFKNVMDVFKLLEKSNCRKCNQKTCLAFAAAVFEGRLPLADCPQLSPEIIQAYGIQPQKKGGNGPDADEQLAELRAGIGELDLAERAGAIGARMEGGRLVLKVMGKDVRVDQEGMLSTDIHVNPWIAAPVLSYILACRGKPLSGRWVPLRELPSGPDWYRLFGQRCEKPMKRVADAYPDLFSDLVDIFSGRPTREDDADIAVVFAPLPLVPLRLGYWHADEGMDSDLHLFFDDTAEANLGIEGIFALGTGITRMFEKLALRHGTVFG